MTALRCRRGWHSWRFVSMGQRREITVPPWTHYVCQLTEECRRCGLRRYRESAPIPRRVQHVTARRWWLILAALAGVEAGCLWGTYQLTRIDVP